MAGKAEIGALRVRLAANVGEFKKGMRNAGNAMQRFSKRVGLNSRNVKRAMKGVGVAAAAAVAAIGAAVSKALGQVDKLTKLSRAIGVPVKQLSAFQHAAELSGVELDKLGRGFRNVARNAQLAAKGPTDFSRSLDKINVAWRETDGSFVRADKLMLEVADKFADMEDGAEKTAIAMKTFGEEVGPRLIPLLNQGRDGIQEMLDRAERLGLVFDQQTGRAAERFNDTLTDFRAQIEGVVTKLTAKLLPSLQFLVDMFSDLGNQNAVVDALVTGFKGFVRVVLTLVNTFKRLQVEIAATAKAVAQAFTGDFTGAMETFNEGQERSIELQEQLNDRLRKFRSMTSGAPGVEAGTGRQAGSERPDFGEGVTFGDDEPSEAVKKTNDQIERGKFLVEGMSDPLQRWQENMAALDLGYKKLGTTAEKVEAARFRANSMLASQYLGLAGDIAGSLSKVFGDSKGVAIAQAVINTAQAVTATLAQYGATPWGLAAAATAAAAGAAEIATIRKTTKSGGGGGRSSSVSGGGQAAGSGAQGQSGGSAQGGGAQQGVNITVQGDTFGREHFLGLIDGLNDALDDGAKLNVNPA